MVLTNYRLFRCKMVYKLTHVGFYKKKKKKLTLIVELVYHYEEYTILLLLSQILQCQSFSYTVILKFLNSWFCPKDFSHLGYNEESSSIHLLLSKTLELKHHFLYVLIWYKILLFERLGNRNFLNANTYSRRQPYDIHVHVRLLNEAHIRVRL